ncbi:MAG: TIGR03545 family protein [Gemmatimonadales bacterium]|nr:TIGR03545 family protein [Gemmatimonadales bacterium]
MTVKIFRWRAIGPLLVLLVIVAILWVLFADTIARRETEKVGTEVLGARVEIEDLHLDLANGDVTIRGLTIASPHEPFRNLLQADELVADLDVIPLLEKKIVIDRIAANGLRFGTPRTTDGRVAATGSGRHAGIATRVMAEARQWASQFDVPVLQLATGEIDIDSLDPRNLTTIKVAEALAARADSSRQAWQSGFDTLRLGPTLDSARETLERLQRARATDLAALNEARRAIDQLKRARDRVTALERRVTTGVSTLRAGIGSLDSARRRDYAFARSLVKLPSLDAPEIGAALFAPGAITPFERVYYWLNLARRYMPPGLRPRAGAGTPRVRHPGADVRFPRERNLPGFLLRSAELSFLLDPTAPEPRRYAGRLTGLTSDPALYGRPTLAVASGPALAAGVLLDHVGAIAEDTAGITVQSVRLPPLRLPALPLTLDPGDATLRLGFALRGDEIDARWSVRSNRISWARDSAAFGTGQINDLIWRTVSGISQLEIEARVTGTIANPTLQVRSNLDQAIAARLRAVLGEDVAAAERRLRAAVDRVVDAQVGPVRSRVTELQAEATARIARERAPIDELQRGLEQRLRQLLPGIPLP